MSTLLDTGVLRLLDECGPFSEERSSMVPDVVGGEGVGNVGREVEWGHY